MGADLGAPLDLNDNLPASDLLALLAKLETVSEREAVGSQGSEPWRLTAESSRNLKNEGPNRV